MLDPRFIERHIDKVKQKIQERGAEIDLGKLEIMDRNRRDIIKKVETLEHERNKGSKEVGELKRNKEEEKASELSGKLKSISNDIKELNRERSKVEEELRDFLLRIPNLQHDSVPVGSGEEQNLEISRWGEPTEFGFEPLDHVELGKRHDILDLERATKITGARFVLYKGQGARLERALINFMLDTHTGKHGYTEVFPPFIANSSSFVGTGNLPKFEDDLFRLEGTNYYLVPTAEVPVTNIYRDEILSQEKLPVKFVAYTACFRKEAGSYGKDVHGIMRQHQFNKVELVKFSMPDTSYDELELLTRDASKILELLGLPYRVVVLCSGDMGFSSAKTYDIEVWIPSEGKYREISSCSNFESFQARRANIRFRKNENTKPEHVHTLNGSGVAIGRAVIAILENFQLEDGRIKIPEVLVPYMGGDEYIG